MEPYDSIVTDWMEFEIPKFYRRDIELDRELAEDFIIAIIGPRRSGKTYFMYQLMSELTEHVERKEIFYINLEDDRLIPLRPETTDRLMESFDELYGPHREIWLFLDEIQNLENWQAWLKRIRSLRKEARIVISGSSAKLLSREMVTGLRGRVYPVEILPVSFGEYVRFKGENPDEIAKRPLGKNASAARKLFREYMERGAYPAIAFGDFGAETRMEIVRTYYETMILRDVVERYEVRDITLLRAVSKLLLNSVASEFTFTKLHNNLKSMGFSPSKSTVIDYVGYFEDAYLFFTVSRWTGSEKKSQSSPKVYAVDVGMIDTLTFTASGERGRRLENTVFMELMRRKKKVFYYRNGKECDFIIYEKDRPTEAIQVTESLEENRDRELKGLRKAMEDIGAKRGLILTENERAEIEGIEVLPVWLWLLKSEKG